MLLSHGLTLILGSYITKLLHVKIYKETQSRGRGVGFGQVGGVLSLTSVLGVYIGYHPASPPPASPPFRQGRRCEKSVPVAPPLGCSMHYQTLPPHEAWRVTVGVVSGQGW